MEIRPVIRKLRLPVAARFHQQYIRPLTADTSSQFIMDRLQESTNDFNRISSSALAALAPDILKPASQYTSQAYIENGWQERRFRFYMEVELERTQYTSKYLMITGFTNHSDISHGGLMDPNMKLFFNNIISYTDSPKTNLMTGDQQINRLVNVNQQVIYPTNHVDMSPFSNRLRPQDVITNMAAEEAGRDAMYTINTVGHQMDVAMTSRQRLIPSVYLSDVLTGSILANQTAGVYETSIDNGYDAYMNNFIGNVTDKTYMGNAFSSSIALKTQFNFTGYVTWGELASLYPEINSDQVSQMEFPKNGSLMDYSMHTEHHKGIGIENQTLAITQNMLPSIMSMFMIQQATLVLTNETLDSQPQIIIHQLALMSDKIDARPIITAFQAQLLQQLIPAISNNNTLAFTMTVSANVLTEMVMRVRFYGGSEIEFAVPLYADSTFTMLGYAERRTLDEITHELRSLTNAVNTALTDNNPSISAQNLSQFSSFVSNPLQNVQASQQFLRRNPFDLSDMSTFPQSDPFTRSDA